MSDEVRINAALRFLFGGVDRANDWHKAPNVAFNGRSALEVMSFAGSTEHVRDFLESKAAAGIAVDGIGRCLLSQKGSIPANVALEIDDPRRFGLASEMPDDLRVLALEGGQAPYEGGTEYGAESPALLEDLIPPANDSRNFSKLELPAEQAEAIKNAKMDPRHDHLSALLEDDFGRRLLAQKGSIPPDVDLEI